MTPEQSAHHRIDSLLTGAGWVVQNVSAVNLYAGEGATKGIAICEFPL